MTPLAEVLILMLGVTVLTLLLGLPLLPPKESLIPDMIGLGILTVAVLAFVWRTGIWWVLLPVLALAALVAWMDRADHDASLERSASANRTRLRFQLVRASNRLTLVVLVVLVIDLIAMATEVRGAIILELIVPWLLVTMVATALFRLSYSRAWDRDMRARGAEETNAVE
jgi:L-asparagine transporter-like permease